LQIPDSDDDNKPAVVENKDHSVLDMVIPQSIAQKSLQQQHQHWKQQNWHMGKLKASRKSSATKTKVKIAKTKATKTKNKTKVSKLSNEQIYATKAGSGIAHQRKNISKPAT